MSATLCLCAGAPFMLGKFLATAGFAHEAQDLINAMIWLQSDLWQELGERRKFGISDL